MTPAQQKKINELRKEYVITILKDDPIEIKIKASNGLTYKNYIIGPRGGLKQQGVGIERAQDLLNQIENDK